MSRTVLPGSAPRRSQSSDDEGVNSDSAQDEVLFRELYPALRRFAAVIAPLSLDPDDLVQSAVARTLTHRPLHEYEHPAAYLRTAMVNLVKNTYRQESRRRKALSDDGGAVQHDWYPSDLDDLQVLSETDRAALFLVDVERIACGDAAAVLGCTTPALRARVSRARRRLYDARRKEQ